MMRILMKRNINLPPKLQRLFTMASSTFIAPASVVPERLTAIALSQILLAGTQSGKIAVIDVRDDGPFLSLPPLNLRTPTSLISSPAPKHEL
jgi:hypothetical protein